MRGNVLGNNYNAEGGKMCIFSPCLFFLAIKEKSTTSLISSQRVLFAAKDRYIGLLEVDGVALPYCV